MRKYYKEKEEQKKNVKYGLNEMKRKVKKDPLSLRATRITSNRQYMTEWVI